MLIENYTKNKIEIVKNIKRNTPTDWSSNFAVII